VPAGAGLRQTGRAQTLPARTSRAAMAPGSKPGNRARDRHLAAGRPVRVAPRRRRPAAISGGRERPSPAPPHRVSCGRAPTGTRRPVTCSGRHPIRRSVKPPSRSPRRVLSIVPAGTAPRSSRPSSPRRSRRSVEATGPGPAAGATPQPRAIRPGLRPGHAPMAPDRSRRGTRRARPGSPVGRAPGRPAAPPRTAPSARRRHHVPGDRHCAP
jgi:hypothetical protein